MSIAELSNSGFISKIIQDVDTGYCFTPLIGSGLSSPSGIIMGMEFTNYLAFTTYLVLSDPKSRPKTHGEGIPGPWDLSHQGWPPLPSNQEVDLARKWIHDQFKEICERFGLGLNYDEDHRIKLLSQSPESSLTQGMMASLVYPRVPTILASSLLKQTEERVRRVAEVLIRQAGDRPSTTAAAVDHVLSDPTRSYHQRLVEMGIRALHDWRETLVVLSSIAVEHHEPAGGEGPRTGLVYGKQRNSIIDRFNSFITRDKRPNLGHKMLAHLSGPMRFQGLLTTNFDTLTEDAFQGLNLRLRVLPVSSRGHLPEPQTVGADCTLVKLHGEMQDTRADTSLDDEPTDEDKRTFVAYLTRGSGNVCRRQSRRESKRLLVIGYSGSDQRCVQMIRHWLEKAPDHPILYWVCFSQADVDKVKRMFAAPEYDQRIRATRCSRPDLLLHELYQRLVLSLPPGGLTYEFSHVVPPIRSRPFDHEPGLVENVLDCSGTVENPLEAARVLLSETAKLDDARRLTRDAGVLALKRLILSVLDEKVKFYDQNDDYISHKAMISVADLWRPAYRLGDDRSRPTAAGDKEVFADFASRPVVIDSLAGVVRGVALAVEELTARSAKKVFWIETQDYMDADALLNDLLRSLAVRFGSFQSRQVTQHPLDRSLKTVPVDGLKEASETIAKHIKVALADYRVDAGDIVVLLYGRDSYGSCAGLIPSPWGCRSGETEAIFGPLHCVIEAFGRAGVRVVYFPLVRGRADAKLRFLERPGSSEAWEVEPLDAEVVDQARQDRWASLKLDVDQWRSWPSDPFCYGHVWGLDASPVDTGPGPAGGGGGPRRNNATSVFRSIIEDVLGPYFDFRRREVRARRQVVDALAERKLVFVYALTLFRHSRYVNALCSEAVFHCPNRFNSSAIDNDFLRTDEISRWIDELRDSRVFFNKPGGSFWMHRDIRLTIQYFLEQLDLGALSSEPPGIVGNRTIRELRSRIHFWIGDWYHKAFCSSGYLLPIVESVHHRVMAAVYSPFAAYKSRPKVADPDELLRYRSLIFESSMLEAHKSLQLSWRALKLWQANPIEVAWVGKEHRDEVGKVLGAAIDSLCEGGRDDRLRGRLRSAVDAFLDQLAAISQELMLEGGASRISSPVRSPFNGALFARSAGAAPRRGEPMKIDHSWRIVNKTRDEFDRYVGKIFRDLDADDLLASIGEISRSNKPVNVAQLSKKKATWKDKNTGDAEKLHDAIWALGEYAYVTLRRAKLLYHSTGMIQFPDWVKITVACNLGVDLCKHLPPWLLPFDIQSKVKLHSLYGVSLANLGRSFEACRHFNEAHALLSKMPDSSPADIAIIQLRRAEALITESFWIGLFLKADSKGMPRFGQARSSPKFRTVDSENFRKIVGVNTMYMIDGDPDVQRAWSMDSVREISRDKEAGTILLVPPRITECIRKSRHANQEPEWKDLSRTLKRLYCGVLDEAVALLDQAEWNLSGHSQSGLWWSRLYTLRLRIFGLLPHLDEDDNKSLILRKYSADQGIFQSFHHALRISQYDPFRRFRTLKYFFEADCWHRKFEGDNNAGRTRMPDSFKEAEAALEQLLKDLGIHKDVAKEKYREDWDKEDEALQSAVMALSRSVPGRNDASTAGFP